MVEVDEQRETAIANLSPKHGVLQSHLDLRFDVGTQVSFYTTGGKVPVHLSGYVVLEDLDESGEEDEETSDESSTDEGGCCV